ncbi:MAG TPA: GNAT family N-acetyltransferase [Actinophytocola sp.]|uniref:GNAT family N-acetyltransferase n=1 Tax=Actinophytocola sp. TaxID=1872138 RepID=UPI002DDD790E|nr:GNAT family N-acetyltransferase [Actinophytocola sp.]HEV2778186.1 GNAT family N-acetyltransferase [Actinophytocola sp.]
MIQTQAHIRPAGPADAEAVRAFLAGLSRNAQYQRFFTGLGSVSPSLVRELVTVTPRQQVMIATLGDEVIGHAMASAARDHAVELGVVVADAHRGRGIATRLMRALLEHAVLAGADRLRLDVLCENQLVLDWIRRALPDTVFERDGYALTGHAPLGPDLLTTVDEVDELVEPEPVAL